MAKKASSHKSPSSKGDSKAVKADPLQAALQRIKDALENYMEPREFNMKQLGKMMSRLAVPVPLNPTEKGTVEDFKFIILPPSAVKVVGSYMLKTKLADGAVDLLVEMPKECFVDLDLLNGRQLWKRQVYLAHVLDILGKTDGVSGVSVDSDNLGIHGRFVVEGVCVNVHIGINSQSFKLHRLAPGKSNIRAECFPECKDLVCASAQLNSETAASMFMYDQLQYQAEAFRGDTIILDAVRMSKAWIAKFPGCRVNGFTVSMLLAYLIREGKVSVEAASEMIIFKGLLSFLVNHDWHNKGLFSGTCHQAESFPAEHRHCMDQEAFMNHFETVFVDPTGSFNIMSAIKQHDILALKYYAERTLEALGSTLRLDFEDILLTKYYSHPEMVFDVICKVSDMKDAALPGKSINQRSNQIDYILDKLTRGLGKRAVISQAWTDRGDTLKVGIVLNPQESFKLAEHGPTPDKKDESMAFRELWNGKAELRRFEDGVVRWAVTWPELAAKRHLVVDRMIESLLQPMKASVASGRLDFAIDIGDSVVPFSAYSEAFERLSTTLRGMSELPLGITQVVPCSPTLRLTEVASVRTEGRVAGRAAPVSTIIVHFERSSRWPDDLQACRYAKQAFLLQIQSILESKHHLPCSLEAKTSFLDVFVKGGLVFRVKLRCDKERDLLAKEEDFEKVREWEAEYEVAGQFHAGLKDIYTGNIVFASIVRIVKRWFSAHLFSFLDEELVEAIVAGAFCRPGVTRSPASLPSGFLRVLQFICEHDYNRPLIIDPQATFSSDVVEDVEKEATFTVHCSFIKTRHLPIKCNPSEAEWKELQVLAKACLSLAEDVDYDPTDMFSPILDHLVIFPIRTALNNAPLLKSPQRIDAQLDKTVRKGAATMSDFCKALPGLNILDAVGALMASRHKVRCFWDRYAGTFVAVRRDQVCEDLRQELSDLS